MTLEFLKYFIGYIFKAKTRQRLLFLAIVGLFLSSFALLVLQSTMGGLQNKLIGRSKAVNGVALISSHNSKIKHVELVRELKKRNLSFHKEMELELLIKNGNYLAPVILRGIAKDNPEVEYLKHKNLDTIILGSDLSNYKLNALEGDVVKVISPTHVNRLFGDVPRMISLEVGEDFQSDVPEVDITTAWIKISSMQNLTRSRGFNRIRFYKDYDFEEIFDDLKVKYPDYQFETWEDRNSTLVWALKLENTVMIFLFVAMTLLVSLCITSGLLVFFGKIRNDLSSFWILGASKDQIGKNSLILLNLISFVSTLSGIIFGLIFLFVLDQYAPEIMPDVFVDRKIPVKVTIKGLLVAFSIPYAISFLFSWFGLSNFSKDHNYLDQVRSIG